MTPGPNGEVVINPDNEDFPDDGLPGVTEITISVDSPADISDVFLHACNEPGEINF